MQYNNATKGDQVNLIINQPGLSSTDDQTAVLEDLEKAVTEVLAEHGAEPTLVKLIDGHTYSSIEADCPQCGDRLTLIEPSLDATNGATATASCNCGWSGDAIYRLIDLHEASSPKTGETEDTLENEVEDILADSSSVNRQGVRPKYTPY